MLYLICVVFGIFIGQEYSAYVPNIKIVYLHLLEYIREQNDKKEIEKKNEDIQNNVDNYMFNLTTYLSGLSGYVPKAVSESISFFISKKEKNE
jgi:hypothetical protein